MRTCPDCRKRKPLEAFPRHAETRDGRNTYCRVCMRARRAVSRTRTEWLPSGPLLAMLDGAGGIARLLSANGLRGKCERDKWTLAVRRARRSGRVKLVTADDMAVTLLGVTVDEIYGYEYEGTAA